MRRSRKIWLGLGFLVFIAVATTAAIPKPRLSESLSFLRALRPTTSIRVFYNSAPGENVYEEDAYLIADSLSNLVHRIAQELPSATVLGPRCYLGTETMAEYEIPSADPDESITLVVIQYAPKISLVVVSDSRNAGAIDRFRNWYEGFFPSKSREDQEQEKWIQIRAAEEAMQVRVDRTAR